jgi:UDP-N-acetylmuramoyl-L-alanyl-D-glutamate--2,6-diaminopimelate ligase
MNASPVALADLLSAAGLPATDRVGHLPVSGLDYDSRRVGPGFLFFAFPGAQVDGRRFAADAVARGACAVVSELPAPEGFAAPWIVVPRGRLALALMARRFYPRVASVRLTGITGTNGKTTTCFLADAILRAAGKVTAMVGTIRYHVAGSERKAVNTTPESLDLYRLFDELAALGGTHASMEVSSHALALGRVEGLRFIVAVFTNLTQDHLDFHKTMEAYFKAKCELFGGQHAPPPDTAVLNADDEWARRVPVRAGGRTIWYGLSDRATLRATNIAMGFDGLRFDLTWEGRRHTVRSRLAGEINVYNILAAVGACIGHGMSLEAILPGVEALAAVPGRFERVDLGQPFLVAVDYAHTDDALRNAIRIARKLARGRVITLFGCGGDRDRAKRPKMGRAAGEGSDMVVLTSDNPRSEDPMAIISDALAGLRETGREHLVEPDREKAIAAAVGAAKSGDVVLLAGKGHEDYQVLAGGRTIHFDDREAAAKALRSLGFGNNG